MTLLDAELLFSKARKLAIHNNLEEALEILKEIAKSDWLYTCGQIDETVVFKPLWDRSDFLELVEKGIKPKDNPGSRCG